MEICLCRGLYPSCQLLLPVLPTYPAPVFQEPGTTSSYRVKLSPSCRNEAKNTGYVCFITGNSPAPEFYMPTFRNTLFHLHRQVYTYLPMKMEQSVPKRPHIKFQTPENYPEESIQHSEHGEILKSRIGYVLQGGQLTNSTDNSFRI